MWSVYLRSLLRWSWFDAHVSVLSFVGAIKFYTYQEEFRRKKQGSIWRTMKVVYSTSNWCHVLAYYAGVYVLQHIIRPPTFPSTLSQTSFISELFNQDGLPWDVAGVAYVLVETVAGIVLYDAIFFLLHLCLHSPRTRGIHQSHHTHQVVRAESVLHHSLLDGIIQVATNVVVQRYNYFTLLIPGYMCTVPKTRIARLLHNILVTWMLTESHANIDVKTQVTFFRRFPKVFPGILRHRIHHKNPRRYYQQFFGYLDDLLERLTGDQTS
jgi:sterol desaturase/sphingolipid hydroxylase (fatty acid hydroxylase superfamily)